MRFKDAEKGFTLIELAIVLVIIGIILGAILKGQALIQNARAKRVLNDMKGLEAMIWTFYDRYGYLPGDCNKDGIIGVNVNSNWNLGYLSTSTTPPASICSQEWNSNQPFDSLKYAGIVDKTAPNRVQFKHALNGPFFIGYKTVGGNNYNVIAVNDIPCWAAKNIDQAIDGNLDSGTGRIRYYSGTTVRRRTDPEWSAVCRRGEDTLVDIVYFFDKQP